MNDSHLSRATHQGLVLRQQEGCFFISNYNAIIKGKNKLMEMYFSVLLSFADLICYNP